MAGGGGPDDPAAAHWAFERPIRHAPPAVRDRRWARNPIDAFILAALEGARLEPATEADRATLLRRLSFDLTGLPPSPSELDDFLSDDSPDAYERVVDRLLASPRHGERWAQHWLDLARYADTDGFEFDQARPNAWRYRDWVVRALNEDVPYDRFVALQLAGDEVEPGDPAAFVATGFNRCYPDMVDLNDQGLRRQNALNDITETTSLVFLGLTLGCARCHDHKFDPLKISDFYRLQAFFAPARFRDDYPLAAPGERQAHERRMTEWQEAVAELQREVIRLESDTRAQLAAGPPPNLDDAVVAAFEKPAQERTAAEVKQVFEALRKDKRIKPDALERSLGPERARERNRLLGELDQLQKSPPPDLPRARGLDETGPTAPPTYILLRGDYEHRGDVVEPGVPEVFGPFQARAGRPTSRSTGRRATLAEWLTRPDHPLTARVIVNRLWQHHFGRGLVGTSNDFGTMGDAPSHPELLDWLATELVRQGWSLKGIHRLILTSATYRQSTKATDTARRSDPENLSLSHQNRQRLDGEAIRDAVLAVSGQLNPQLEGPCVFPELPRELTRLSSKGAIWPLSPLERDRNRRSLYVFIRRNLRYPFFEAFDRPDTNASCPRRSTTTIAPQALSLLNGSLAWDAANALARRLEREGGVSDASRIDLAYRLTLGRRPDAEESRLAQEFVAARPGSWTAFALALLNLNEFVYID